MTLLEIVQQQSVLINQLVLSNRNMEMQLEKQSGELAAVRETVENQSTSMVTALATSLSPRDSNFSHMRRTLITSHI